VSKNNKVCGCKIKDPSKSTRYCGKCIKYHDDSEPRKKRKLNDEKPLVIEEDKE